eukprot:UN24442
MASEYSTEKSSVILTEITISWWNYIPHDFCHFSTNFLRKTNLRFFIQIVVSEVKIKFVEYSYGSRIFYQKILSVQ